MTAETPLAIEAGTRGWTGMHGAVAYMSGPDGIEFRCRGETVGRIDRVPHNGRTGYRWSLPDGAGGVHAKFQIAVRRLERDWQTAHVRRLPVFPRETPA